MVLAASNEEIQRMGGGEMERGSLGIPGIGLYRVIERERVPS